MTIFSEQVERSTQAQLDEQVEASISLAEFINDFGDGLLASVERECPPVYTGSRPVSRDAVLDGLKRRPFDAQRESVHAATTLLLDKGEKAVVLNCDMGTGVCQQRCRLN